MNPNSTQPTNQKPERLPTIGLVLGAVLFLVILFFADMGNAVVSRTAAIGVLMAVWWTTQALPLAITALLPLVLFPALGIQSGKETASTYTNWIVFLYIGGFLVALAMERWNLHRRIALHILARSGSSPSAILFGFMAATAFLSMWISNTATTMMMIPIGIAILLKWEELTKIQGRHAFGIGLMLAIPYASSIGGISTLVGTPPNMTFVGIYEQSFPGRESISFTTWLIFAFPITLTLFAITWFLLTRPFKTLNNEGHSTRLSGEIIQQELQKLGPMNKAESRVLAIFCFLAIAWLFRSPLSLPWFTVPGWSALFSTPKFIDDGTVAIAFALLLFIIPSGKIPGERLLDASILPNLPWGIVLLFGGGFALASGFESSGLSLWVGEQLTLFRNLPLPILIALVCLVITFLTEVTSNTASAQILLPLLAAMAIELGYDPLLIMIPGTITCSCAFMLPVGTPPNAIAFGSGRLEMRDMVRSGLALNLISVVVVTAAMLLYGRVVFGI